MSVIRVGIVHHSDIVCRALTNVLESSRYHVAFAGGLERRLNLECVDVVLMGERAATEGVLAVKEVAACGCAVIVLSDAVSGVGVATALELGAKGFLCFADPLIEILGSAVERVFAGRAFLSASANEVYMDFLRTERGVSLDERTKEVLVLLSKGVKGTSIREQLGLNAEQLKYSRRKLRMWFGTDTTEGVIAQAVTG